MTAIIATNNGGCANYEPAPAGNHVARCISMVHIGTVEEEYLGEKKMQNKVRITWELPEEKKVFKEENGEQPFVLSKEFTLSMHEKSSLRKWLESWRGKSFTEEESKQFDVAKLVGAPCLLNVIHKEKKDGNKIAAIASVSTMPKSMVCPTAINPLVVFSVTDFKQEIFDTFPDFLKDKIKSSREYIAMQQPNVVEIAPAPAEEQSDDLPF